MPIISVSLTLQPYLFQLFHPIGGVLASWSYFWADAPRKENISTAITINFFISIYLFIGLIVNLFLVQTKILLSRSRKYDGNQFISIKILVHDFSDTGFKAGFVGEGTAVILCSFMFFTLTASRA